jgi:hypothetical protein
MGQTASIDRTYWFIAGYHYKLKKRKNSAVSWKIDRFIPSNSVNVLSVNLGGNTPFVEEELHAHIQQLDPNVSVRYPIEYLFVS